ncbi:MAG: ABC transporter ATP-binding protein, partial [Phycisphaerae bacterium]|nr:ABC transporter ATP-binding protein [Phycisphaerae bacterium]
LVIAGSSGSGKSTLLNILGCLDRPTSGRYVLDGADVSGLPDDALSEVRSRRLGFIFQSFNLIQQLTVLENIEVPLFYQGMHKNERRARSEALAERVGLADRAGHKPMELSGGQQQRVAIARSLANDPVVILADEPTGNLDTHTSEAILKIFEDLNEQGKTLVVVTHEQKVIDHAHRTMYLADGRLTSTVDGRRAGPGAG